MPGIHKHNTVSFRPSDWERSLIEERAALSGIYKKDFIAKSCIYSNIVVTGTKEHLQKIIDEVQNMQETMKEITGQLLTGDLFISESGLQEMINEYLALAITLIDILNGASYLFDKKPPESADTSGWKESLELKEYRRLLGLEMQEVEKVD